MVKSKVNHFDLGKFVFWPWSKRVFFGLISCQNLRLTILTTKNLDFGHGYGRNFDHLTIFISKFWPWSWSIIFDHMTMTPARRSNGQKIMVALPSPLIQLSLVLTRPYQPEPALTQPSLALILPLSVLKSRVAEGALTWGSHF